MKRTLALCLGLMVLPGLAMAEAWSMDTATGCRLWNEDPRPQEQVRWSGPCVAGKAQGRGVANWTVGGQLLDHYEGDYVAGKMEGHGVYTYENGVRYEGDIRHNQWNGYGRLSTPSQLVDFQAPPAGGHWEGNVYVQEGRWVDDDLVESCRNKLACARLKQKLANPG